MMEAGRYDESLEHFAELSKKDNHPQVQLAWASVYAARAGVRVRNLMGLAKALSKMPAMPKLEEQQIIPYLKSIREVWKYIPSVNEAGRKDLELALKVMPSQKPEVRIYAAVLRGIRIKSVLDKGVPPWEKARRSQACVPETIELAQWTSKVLVQINAMYEDLATALPKENQIYRRLQDDVSTSQSRIMSSQKSRSNQCLY
ncbi:hypothetical protein D3C87_87590 [compost metagenome]